MPNADTNDGTLLNKVIRGKIKLLSQKYSVSYGQAQKVVNVCLKQYMFLTRKYDFAEELDCPLDSTTMKGYEISNNRMNSVNENDYKQYQTLYNQNYELRILKDEDYDKQRINNYITREK